MTADIALHLTEAISTYMKAKFLQKLHSCDDYVPFPSDWDFTLLQECDLAVDVLTDAYRRKYVTQWRADDYVAELTERATGRNSKVEAKLLKKFPPIFSPTVYQMEPCIVTDMDGNILVWYIPGALTTQRSTQMWDDMHLLERSIHTKGCSSWRGGPTFFRAEEGWLKPGNVSMAPAWFQQAHEKSNNMEVSAALMQNGNMAWVEKQIRASALVGGMLSIIHPRCTPPE
ncbi:hypothetical protein BDZ97DRAFT_1762563 [Flammula alnicola]|nr:hypothetical protein BDZ97DRAFT_1762563 [Flammula alnicola]